MPVGEPLRRRAKPFLGTLVEIAASARSEAQFVQATDAAFERIAQVHRAMSFHEPSSDLRAIARAPSQSVLAIAPDTWNTLALALDMEAASDGIFNAAIAPALVSRGLLPPPDGAQTPQAPSLREGIALESDFGIRILAPVWIDLGGIAKGHAVDLAVAALTAQGIESGVVNAGGDLRVFGPLTQALSVRWPAHPTQAVTIARITDLSGATSGGYFLNVDAAAIAHPGMVGHREGPSPDSVTVIAPRCAVADALTKVLWLRGPDAQAVLRRYDAQAVLIDRLGHITRI